MYETLVIIPTYNEKENIESIIRAVFSQENTGFKADVLVVDDNSPDGTAIIVSNLQKEFPKRLFIENRKEKKGLGAAYIHGFKWAITQRYNYIMEMDADFSHNPTDLIKLYNACANEGADVSVGSRYKNGKISVINWDFKRIMLSYYASRYVKLITRIPIDDTTAGFMCYKREVLEKIKFNDIHFIGYAFQIEMKFKAWKHGFKIREVPVVFTDRVLGNSKMDSSIIGEAIFGVLKMKLKGLPK